MYHTPEREKKKLSTITIANNPAKRCCHTLPLSYPEIAHMLIIANL